MINFETVNELSLKITCSGGGDVVYTKAGAFIGGECMGPKNYQFEKVLLGPQGNPLAALGSQLLRRFTGENLPLMKVSMRGDSVTYYANEAQHVVVLKLNPGESVSVESENILAFTADCRYSVRFLAQGVISQKGLATSTITGGSPNSFAAILVDGNPLIFSNTQTGNTIEIDPDTVVAWVGADPGFKLDLSWKNLIGQASGESYMFEWGAGRGATIVIQPNERTSGVDISMDGRRTGASPSSQSGISMGQTMNDMGNTMSNIGNMLGGNGAGTGNGAGGIMGAIGSLFH